MNFLYFTLLVFKEFTTTLRTALYNFSSESILNSGTHINASMHLNPQVAIIDRKFLLFYSLHHIGRPIMVIPMAFFLEKTKE